MICGSALAWHPGIEYIPYAPQVARALQLQLGMQGFQKQQLPIQISL